MPTSPNPAKTDAERQALRRQRRNEEIGRLKAALVQIAKVSDDVKARTIAMNALANTEN
jgi:hypothetical protein